MALNSNVEPASAASASAIDGIKGSKEGLVGTSSVSKRALDALALSMPSLRARASAHSAATLDQSGCTIPFGASGLDLLYAITSAGSSQWDSSLPPLQEAW